MTQEEKDTRHREITEVTQAWINAAYPAGGPGNRSTARIIKAGDAMVSALLGIDRASLEGEEE
jgi:hypothetical protein